MSQGNISNPASQTQPLLTPVTALVGTSVNYGQQLSVSWIAGNQYSGNWFNRSNATVAMTDTLPNPATSMGDLPKLPNGWNISISNVDASASIALTPVTPSTINGTTSLTIAAAHVSKIVTDGTNWFSSTSPN